MAPPTQRTVFSSGVSIAVAETGDRAGPPVVFIHGYPDTKEMWDLVIGGLPDRFHAVAYDVRGAGSSSVPRGSAAYDFERLGDDLLAVLDAIAPSARVHLVGHDWGGLQGWEFATQPRFEGRLASFTAIAAPSLDQIALAGEDLRRSGRAFGGLVRARRSWYVLLLLAPGGPSLWWRVLGARGRWQWMLELVERVRVGDGYPARTLVRDGLAGANLYRRNIPRRLLRPRRDAVAHVPVQLIVPSGDRHIPRGYYQRVERHAPRLRRRVLGTGHWAPRTEPELLARWISSFVDDVENGAPIGRSPS